VVIVAPLPRLGEARQIASASVRAEGRDVAIDVVAGGADRTASVAAGLRALGKEDGIVLVHDAARALAPTSLFEAVIHAVRAGHPAVVPGLPVADTIKTVDAAGRVQGTPDRETLRAVQTPQGFLREVLEHAHASGESASDDAALVERIGGHVRMVPGDARAMKITTPHDLAVAELLLREG
jgi:2-C-methyl-D-erythritol 4-phosphate cytidylyltransferase